jgi:hypothetical protein
MVEAVCLLRFPLTSYVFLPAGPWVWSAMVDGSSNTCAHTFFIYIYIYIYFGHMCCNKNVYLGSPCLAYNLFGPILRWLSRWFNLLPRALLIYLFVVSFRMCVPVIACCGVVMLQNVVPILGCYKRFIRHVTRFKHNKASLWLSRNSSLSWLS